MYLYYTILDLSRSIFRSFLPLKFYHNILYVQKIICSDVICSVFLYVQTLYVKYLYVKIYTFRRYTLRCYTFSIYTFRRYTFGRYTLCDYTFSRWIEGVTFFITLGGFFFFQFFIQVFHFKKYIEVRISDIVIADQKNIRRWLGKR